MIARYLMAWLAAASLLVASAPARAQAPDPKAVAAAEALFRKGRALMDQERFEQACAKLAESLRLDRAIGTLWHLARCYEAQNKHASAWSLFLEVAAMARNLGRPKQQAAAQKRAAKLEPQLCRLKLLVEKTPMDEVKTYVDGQELGKAGWGTSVPVDCGKHELKVERNGASTTVEIEVAEPGEDSIIEAPLPTPSPAEPDKKSKPKNKTEPKGPAWYGDWLGWTMVGAGAALGGASGFLFVRGQGFEDDAEASADLAERDALFDDADNARLFGLVAGGAGAALLVTGIIKLGMHESDAGATVTPTTDGAAASLWWRF